ncbi:MAG: CHAP domain-containing protein [Candidatus Absconditabacterales bacterium]
MDHISCISLAFKVIMRRKKTLTFHQRIHHHLRKHFHRHIHKVLYFVNHVHYHLFHSLELLVIIAVTISSGSLLFANLTGLNENLYRNNDSEVAQQLLNAMQNPASSLKQGNIISIWNMELDVENSFAKGYCTYGAARISPEFFPFIDEKTQQRTWGGNAVDRCKNASDTGYKIGSIPSQGALIIYDAGGRFGSYGHVGKVLHYDNQRSKIIVRDMAWVGRGTMSDRREDLTTANVKCYIYNSKTNTPDPVIAPVEPTIPAEPILPIVHTGTTTPITTPTIPNTPAKVVTPIQPVIPVKPPVIITPTVPVDISQTSINKNIELTFTNLSDIAEHFMTQNDVIITLVSKSPLKLGEVATLTLEIKDKKSGKLYSGLLPFSFTFLSTNDVLQSSITNVQMINNGSVDISILAQKLGMAVIVINMDDTKIGEFSLEVK